MEYNTSLVSSVSVALGCPQMACATGLIYWGVVELLRGRSSGKCEFILGETLKGTVRSCSFSVFILAMMWTAFLYPYDDRLICPSPKRSRSRRSQNLQNCEPKWTYSPDKFNISGLCHGNRRLTTTEKSNPMSSSSTAPISFPQLTETLAGHYREEWGCFLLVELNSAVQNTMYSVSPWWGDTRHAFHKPMSVFIVKMDSTTKHRMPASAPPGSSRWIRCFWVELFLTGLRDLYFQEYFNLS